MCHPKKNIILEQKFHLKLLDSDFDDDAKYRVNAQQPVTLACQGNLSTWNAYWDALAA